MNKFCLCLGIAVFFPLVALGQAPVDLQNSKFSCYLYIDGQPAAGSWVEWLGGCYGNSFKAGEPMLEISLSDAMKLKSIHPQFSVSNIPGSYVLDLGFESKAQLISISLGHDIDASDMIGLTDAAYSDGAYTFPISDGVFSTDLSFHKDLLNSWVPWSFTPIDAKVECKIVPNSPPAEYSKYSSCSDAI